ncbi:MAG TPA: DUF3106 domain-containing protein [Candidatus Acidoferrales bacterium]
MIGRSSIFRVLCCAALLALSVQSASAQQRYHRIQNRRAAAQKNPSKPIPATEPSVNQKPAANPRPTENGAARPNAAAPAQGQPNARSMAGLPPKWVDQLRDLSPEEQHRFMQNNARFKSLPPDRQAQIRQNLEKWNQLTPEQRNEFRRREEVFGQMTPDQKQYVRDNLLPRWQALSPERRQLILGRQRVLNNMPPATREAKLNDPEFMRGLSPDEQQTLRDLNTFRNPPPPTQ